ncbi:MBL fold metallo-hydrolase [Ottowia thiooxydans]|uniref:MBL fold metallo-hydrolase n=1 Tax=Ottowia thiooxydans TaxID=219182 RepID=UPI000418EB06|nr:MBL fold metallo-hydrolase [Ottowia thiooxydans]
MKLDFARADMTVHRIIDLEAPFLHAMEMLPALTPQLLDENRHWLQDSLDESDAFKLCYQAYLVRTPHHNILVDSCLGNHKSRPRPEWHMKTNDSFMRGLARLGLTPADIDYVMCTHLHGDHVGWNTQLVNGEWVPTFSNARYVFSKREMEWASAEDKKVPLAPYQDSVLPVIRKGMAELVEDNYALGDHVRLLPTPGHTEGHVSFCFGRERDELVVTGDLIHVPLQMRYPELNFARDKDPELAQKTRRNFLERYCDTPTLCCTSHFPPPSAGRVRRWGDGYRMDYSN